MSNLKIDLLKNVDSQDIESLLFYRCDITCSESNFHLFMNIYKIIDITTKTIARQYTTQSQSNIICEAMLASDNALIYLSSHQEDT